jgi:hypothetical protein
LTVTVRLVDPVEAKLGELAVAVVVVAAGGALTTIDVEPLEFAKLPVAAKLAVIVLLPMARPLPLTVRLAAEFETSADPNVVLPRVKVTVPAGAALPLAAFTVAVNTVLAEDNILAGLAETVVVVPTGGAVTAIIVEPLEFEKLPVAE